MTDYTDILAEMSEDALNELEDTLEDVFWDLKKAQDRLARHGLPITVDMPLHIHINDAKRDISIMKAEIGDCINTIRDEEVQRFREGRE